MKNEAINHVKMIQVSLEEIETIDKEYFNEMVVRKYKEPKNPIPKYKAKADTPGGGFSFKSAEKVVGNDKNCGFFIPNAVSVCVVNGHLIILKDNW